MNHPKPSNFRLLLALGTALSAMATISGCRGDRDAEPPRQFFPDMDDQPKWKNQGESTFFSDGRIMRPPVQNAVAFGRVPWQIDASAPGNEWAAKWMGKRQDLLREDMTLYTGMAEEGVYSTTIPLPVSRDMLEHGRKKYEIYCSVCHGHLGDGKGTVGLQWGAVVPSYHDPKYKDAKVETGRDGYIFSVIRNGVRTMPSYGHALTERDAWAVVAYVRALQAAAEGTLGDVPAEKRDQVQRSLPAAGQSEPMGAQK